MKKKRDKDRQKTDQNKQGEATGQTKLEKLEHVRHLLQEIAESELPPGTTFAEYEERLMEIANEMIRRELERKLQTMADAQPAMITIGHSGDWHARRDDVPRRYRRHAPGTVVYHSLVGGLRVRRCSYRECVRNGVTYIPLELDAGLVERMTPKMARATAEGFSQLPMRQVEKLLLAAARIPPSRSTLERCARDIGAYAVATNDEIEPLVREEEAIDDRARVVALGLDRTSVLMRNNDDGFDVQCGRHKVRPRGAKRRRLGVQWRSDYVGTVSIIDTSGERKVTRQYRLPSERDPHEILIRMMADLRHALQTRPELRVAIVQDGAPELWRAMRQQLRNEPLVTHWDEILDWYHLDERLAACTELCLENPTDRRSQRARWHKALLEGPNGIKHVLNSLRHYRRKLVPEQRPHLSKHMRYFAKRRAQTAYFKFAGQGLPIGSGVTEGGCKSLIGVRAKRGGQHWTQRGLSAALHLRAIAQSDRFDAFWFHFQQSYRAWAMMPHHPMTQLSLPETGHRS